MTTQPSRLVGIAGTNHSGKDTGAEHLALFHGFMHISMSDVLRAEARARGLDTDRPTLIEIGVGLREEHGPGAVVLRGIEQWKQKRDQYLGGLVLSSIRVVGEAEEVKRQKGTLLFIDAPAELRYGRARARVRGDETFTTLEEYIEQERTELEGLGGPNRPHLRAVQAVSDHNIMNTGTMDEYASQLDEALGLPAH